MNPLLLERLLIERAAVLATPAAVIAALGRLAGTGILVLALHATVGLKALAR